MPQEKKPKEFRTSIGGQALIEGILMRGPYKQAIVISTKDGFVTKTEDLKLLKDKYPIVGIPFIRGTVNFVSSMVNGVRALMFSAECMPEDEQNEPSKFDLWIERKFGAERFESILVGISVVLGVLLSIGLFMLLPTFLAGFTADLVNSTIVTNLLEGVLRVAIFLSYLWLVSKLKEMRRVWAYHGAEHKAIFCYEKGLRLTVENVKLQPRLHPRCGTSFMFIVMIVSILVFSFTSWPNVWVRISLRLALLPVVVGVSYELIRFAGRCDNILTRMLSAPGKLLQRLTTKEPDEIMIKTAIESLTLVIPEHSADASW